jgi:hypothetical protein
MSRIFKGKIKLVVILGLTLVVVLGSAGYIYTLLRNKNESAIPNSIIQRVGFNVYAPVLPKQSWFVEPGSSSYSPSSGVLTLHFQQLGSSLSMVVTEQGQPDTFNDIAGYYEQLLQDLNQYDIIQVGLGTFTLTHPTELHGSQTAVGDIDSTLLFAHPSQNMSDSQWTDFFNTLSKVN